MSAIEQQDLVNRVNSIAYRVENAASTAFAIDMLLEHCGSSDTVRTRARSVAEGLSDVLGDLASSLMNLAEDVRIDGVQPVVSRLNEIAKTKTTKKGGAR